ncbi:MAG TPA: hypothetical protein EYQ14_00110 [Gammaproteobacteria bacterium]|nr:hypothetical protein [Gammaproteobacteria bacterium]HIL98745.1 hypothetical protein [Pseudomonadales bacterium]
MKFNPALFIDALFINALFINALFINALVINSLVIDAFLVIVVTRRYLRELSNERIFFKIRFIPIGATFLRAGLFRTMFFTVV